MVRGSLVHCPLSVVKSCTLSRKTAPKKNVSTSVLYCGDGILLVILGISVNKHPDILDMSSGGEVEMEETDSASRYATQTRSQSVGGSILAGL